MLTDAQMQEQARRWLNNANDACRDGDFVRAASYLKEAKKFMGFKANSASARHLKAVLQMTSERVKGKR